MKYLLSSAAILISASISPALANSTYDVAAASTAPVIDGKVDEDAWKSAAPIIGGFHFPWERAVAPATEFRALHDGATLFFSFVVSDPSVVVLETPKGERETVDEEDRVELFFAGGPIDKPVEYEMPVYYAAEVDPAGRVHDYSMKYYRQIDSAWSLPGLKTAATRSDAGYTVEASIPLASLRELGVLKPDGQMRTGVFRAEFTPKDGKLDMRWISWVDPATPIPDFHVDSAFGLFRLVDLKQ